MTRQELIQSLRLIADFYEHTDVTLPYVSTFNAFVDTKDELVKVVRALGSCEKGANDDFFYVKKVFGAITIDWNLDRGVVCRRVVVGRHTVPERVIPAHEEETIEWHCDRHPWK